MASHHDKQRQKTENNAEIAFYILTEGIRFFDEQREQPLDIGKVSFLNIGDNELEEIFQGKASILESTKYLKEEKDFLIKESEEYLRQFFLDNVCSMYKWIAEPGKTLEAEIESAILETKKALEVVRYSIPATCDYYPGSLKIELGLSGSVKAGSRKILMLTSSGAIDVRSRQSNYFSVESDTRDKLNQLCVPQLSTILAKSDDLRTEFEVTMLRSLHWISESYIQDELENQILTLIIALETLLTKDIPLRAASILSRISVNQSEKEIIKQKFKKFFDARHRIVHGSKNNNVKEGIVEVDIIWLRNATTNLMIQALKRHEEDKAIKTREDFLRSMGIDTELEVDEKKRLQHIIEQIDFISNFTNGINSSEEFEADLKTVYAVTCAIENIGEAADNLSKNILTQCPDDLPKLIRMKDKIIHKYYELDCQTIWNVATGNLPSLRQKIQVILEKLE